VNGLIGGLRILGLVVTLTMVSGKMQMRKHMRMRIKYILQVISRYADFSFLARHIDMLTLWQHYQYKICYDKNWISTLCCILFENTNIAVQLLLLNCLHTRYDEQSRYLDLDNNWPLTFDLVSCFHIYWAIKLF